MILKKIGNYGRKNGIKALAVKLGERLEYKLEAGRYTAANTPDGDTLALQRLEKYDKKITVSICVPVYNTDKKMLEQMLLSVLGQTYADWELCIADGSSQSYAYIESMVRGLNDSRVVYKRLSRNMGISVNSNEACALATGEYIALLDHDDVLSPDALYEVRKAIDEGADFIYSDEASFSSNVKRPDIIHFKRDFSIFDLRGNNYICHLSVFKRSLFEAVGGFRAGFEGSQDHDLILRLCERAQKIHHIPKVLYNWRVHRGSVASDIEAKPYCVTSGIEAVKDHLNRMGIPAEVTGATENASVYRVKYTCLVKPAIINDIENIRGVTNEYIIVAKPDIRFRAGSVNELCSILQLSGVGMVGGMIIRNGRIEHASLMQGADGLYSPYSGMSALSEGYMKRLKYAQGADALPYQFFGVRRSVLEKMGWFEENLREDDKLADMCRRMKKLGYDIVFDPYAVAERG